MKKNIALVNILRNAAPLAVLPETLSGFLNVVNNGNLYSLFKTKDQTDTVKYNPYEVVNGNAIIKIEGAIYYKENCETMVGGGTSNEYIQSALLLASEDPTVERIVLDINSPGGEIGGTKETGDLIASLKSKKEVIAYVGDLAASAAYWIASQASKIIISETAALGSIGVRAVVYDYSKYEENQGIKSYSFLSSQSPLKDLNLENNESLQDLQNQLDYLANIFIESVSSGRKVDKKIVLENFGRGGIVYGLDAIQRGMADSIGTLSEIINSNTKFMGKKMEQKTIESETLDFQAIERKRILELLAIPTESDSEKEFISKCIENGATPESAALQILNARKTRIEEIKKLRAEDARTIPEINSDETAEINEQNSLILQAKVLTEMNSKQTLRGL